MTFSTDDCKKLLIEKFPETSAKEWKRTRKYKNDNKVVCRDFEHSVKGIVVIEENNSQLVLISQQDKVIDTSKIFYQKVFADEDIKAAKKIFDRIINPTDEERNSRQEYVPTFADEGFHAIPALLDFFFDKEAFDEDECKAIVKQKNMFMKPSELPFAIFNNYPKNDVDDMVGGYGREILPSYFDEVSESSYEIDINDNYNLTIHDVFKMMLEKGFTYDKNNCLIKTWLKDYTIIQRPETTLEIEIRETRRLATIAVQNDDADTFKKLLYKDSFDNDMTINLSRLQDYCKDESKLKCYEILRLKQQEDNNKSVIALKTKDKVFNASKVFCQKTFDKKDIDSAKKLFDRLISCTQQQINNLDYEPIRFEEDGYNAIPSLLEFYFDSEIFEYNKKECERILREKDMLAKPADMCLCIKNIYPRDEYSYLLSECTKHILPHSFNSILDYSELRIEPYDANNDKKLNIHDVFEKLLGLGFVYNIEKCMFKELLNEYTIIEKEESNFDLAVRETRIEAEQAIKKDDDVKLKLLISRDSFNKDMTIDNHDLYVFCKSTNKRKCFNLLLSEKLIE